MDDENWWEANFQMHCFILHGSCMHFTKPPYTKLLKSDKGYKETSSFLYHTGHNGGWLGGGGEDAHLWRQDGEKDMRISQIEKESKKEKYFGQREGGRG